jgi:hypothetical protein
MRISRLFPLLLCALLLASCGGGLDLNSCKDTADLFMERMSKGDIRGAYDLCDSTALNYDALNDIANNPENKAVFNDYKGLEFGEGGQKTDKGEVTEIRLAPATPTGHKGFSAQFAFRKDDKGWKIIGFKLASKADGQNGTS